MAVFSFPGSGPSAGSPFSFAARFPSITWEQIPFDELPAGFFWAWFKPVTAPHGVFLRIPEDARVSPDERPTMRRLLHAVGIDVACVSALYLYGAPCGGANDTSAFDEAIPPPAPGADPTIGALVNAAVMVQPATAGAATGNFAQMFDDIEADCSASRQLEMQLTLLRKQLASLMGRLKTLDRDLSPEERLHGDRQNRSDWEETRRWLKEAATKLSRYIKEHDIGETSAAGKKVWFDQMYRQFVVPRQPFDDLPRVQKEFESYRKRLQILLNNMTGAQQNAVAEGERRAEQVLSRLAVDVRKAKTKKIESRLTPRKLGG